VPKIIKGGQRFMELFKK